LEEPNLVALQDEALNFLPTVLVCPFQRRQELTVFRAEVIWNDHVYVVCTDLTRPIRRTALSGVGDLGEEDSARVMRTFTSLLAR
jgi:hypothetical protein